jgi:hypothetical protein
MRLRVDNIELSNVINASKSELLLGGTLVYIDKYNFRFWLREMSSILPLSLSLFLPESHRRRLGRPSTSLGYYINLPFPSFTRMFRPCFLHPKLLGSQQSMDTKQKAPLASSIAQRWNVVSLRSKRSAQLEVLHERADVVSSQSTGDFTCTWGIRSSTSASRHILIKNPLNGRLVAYCNCLEARLSLSRLPGLTIYTRYMRSWLYTNRINV